MFKKRVTKLSFTLQGMLKARGLEARLGEYRILNHWEKAVGPVIALHARPVRLQGKKLFLTVDSPAWMQQLSLLKPEVIEKINSALGRAVVSSIALNLGEIAVSETHTETAPVLAALDAADNEAIERYVQEIRDPETKAAVRRVIEKDFRVKKGKKTS